MKKKDDKSTEIPLLSAYSKGKEVISARDFIALQMRAKKIRRLDIPPYCVFSFWYMKVKDKIEKKYKHKKINILDHSNPFYIIEYKDFNITYFDFNSIGGPYAGAIIEEFIALGGRYFIVTGGVGVLCSEIEKGEILIPTKAIREEGMSYHYQKPGKFSFPSRMLNEKIKSFLDCSSIQYSSGTTWTTDAVYREKVERIKKYRNEGCLCVEMEAASLFAISKFRKVETSAIFCAGDSVSDEKWNPRLDTSKKKKRESLNPLKIVEVAFETMYSLQSINT